MSISKHVKDRDRDAFIVNSQDGGTDRRTNDQIAHQKLDAIANALGAATTTTTVVLNKAVPIANVEISQALPTNTKNFVVRSRLGAKIRLAFNSGETATNYLTIMPGNVYTNTQYYIAQTLYFQSTKAGDTLEIVASY